jgi:hypothetical protein
MCSVLLEFRKRVDPVANKLPIFAGRSANVDKRELEIWRESDIPPAAADLYKKNQRPAFADDTKVRSANTANCVPSRFIKSLEHKRRRFV